MNELENELTINVISSEVSDMIMPRMVNKDLNNEVFDFLIKFYGELDELTFNQLKNHLIKNNTIK